MDDAKVVEARFNKAINILKSVVNDDCKLSSVKFKGGKGCNNCPFEQDGYCALRVILYNIHESKNWESTKRKEERDEMEKDENDNAPKVEIIVKGNHKGK